MDVVLDDLPLLFETVVGEGGVRGGVIGVGVSELEVLESGEAPPVVFQLRSFAIVELPDVTGFVKEDRGKWLEAIVCAPAGVGNVDGAVDDYEAARPCQRSAQPQTHQ